MIQPSYYRVTVGFSGIKKRKTTEKGSPEFITGPNGAKQITQRSCLLSYWITQSPQTNIPR